MREDRILGNMHVELAIMYATRNFDRGEMISRSIWNEIILYASMQRQIHRGFDLVGVKSYSGKVVVVEEDCGDEARPRIDVTDDKKRAWGVRSAEELLERMALFHLENH
ncbi:MAG: KEOPS complex subunit Cgi121 [Thermoplasmata archaeon]